MVRKEINVPANLLCLKANFCLSVHCYLDPHHDSLWPICEQHMGVPYIGWKRTKTVFLNDSLWSAQLHMVKSTNQCGHHWPIREQHVCKRVCVCVCAIHWQVLHPYTVTGQSSLVTLPCEQGLKPGQLGDSFDLQSVSAEPEVETS